MINQNCLHRLLWATVLAVICSTYAFAEDEPTDKRSSADRYLELGTAEGVLGGEKQKAFERAQIKTQILTFIPPLLRPAFTQHAYILPPGAFSVSVSSRFTEIEGDDFFLKGSSNKAVFADFDVKRNFLDFDFFYGFDLNRKYLHGFTLRLNVPYVNSSTDGFVHPNGQQFISIESAGSTQGIGDVGIFLKKKLFDQGTFPLGIAVVGAVFLPTGDNDDTFGSNGRITTKRPQPPNTTAAQGFDAVMQANFENAFIGDFPFSNGVFGRFSGDGRFGTSLQPGTGSTSYLLGAFLTRQLGAGGW